jgi:Zn-dependent peptidase ImmA (M78 family)
MHRHEKQRPGTKTAEQQAHRFAGAFLAPKASIRSEVPDDLDWGTYLELKIRWGLSMAALVHRAHDLRIMSDATYSRAMKQRSAYGWRRVEPGTDLRPLPQPSLLARAREAAGMSVADVAALAGIPVAVANRIIGAGPRPVVRV